MRKEKAVDRLFGCPPGTVVMRDSAYRRTRVFDSWKEAKAWMALYHPDLLLFWPRRKPRNCSALSYEDDSGTRKCKVVWIMGFILEVY